MTRMIDRKGPIGTSIDHAAVMSTADWLMGRLVREMCWWVTVLPPGGNGSAGRHARSQWSILR